MRPSRHLGIVVLVLAGAALRIGVIVAYQPAFWYRGDSGSYLRLSEHSLQPDLYRPLGYVVALKALRPTGTLQSVVIVQHALGLAVAVAGYAFLHRRGLPRWLCCLATVPLIFDSLLVTLEHFVLVETVFTTMLVGAVLVVLWRPAPGPLAGVVAGLLVALAWFTKPLALPVGVVLLGYLVLRRVGWGPVAGFTLAAVLPGLAVITWVDGRPSAYGSNSTAIYGRMASFADCTRPPLAAALTPAERELCPAPTQRGQRPDWYIWVQGAPGYDHRLSTEAYPRMRGFAVKVLAAQPADYLRVVGKETAAHVVPGIALGPAYVCLRERFSMPATARDPATPLSHCHPELARDHFDSWYAEPATNPPTTPLTRVLAAYSSAVRTSQVVVSAALGLTLLAVASHRGGDRSLARDAAMLTSAGLALIVPPVLVGMHEVRYALPALPLASLAAALALRHLLPARRSHHP